MYFKLAILIEKCILFSMLSFYLTFSVFFSANRFWTFKRFIFTIKSFWTNSENKNAWTEMCESPISFIHIAKLAASIKCAKQSKYKWTQFFIHLHAIEHVFEFVFISHFYHCLCWNFHCMEITCDAMNIKHFQSTFDEEPND